MLLFHRAAFGGDFVPVHRPDLVQCSVRIGIGSTAGEAFLCRFGLQPLFKEFRHASPFGKAVKRVAVEHRRHEGEGIDQSVTWTLHKPLHDAHLFDARELIPPRVHERQIFGMAGHAIATMPVFSMAVKFATTARLLRPRLSRRRHAGARPASGQYAHALPRCPARDPPSM